MTNKIKYTLLDASTKRMKKINTNAFSNVFVPNTPKSDDQAALLFMSLLFENCQENRVEAKLTLVSKKGIISRKVQRSKSSTVFNGSSFQYIHKIV